MALQINEEHQLQGFSPYKTEIHIIQMRYDKKNNKYKNFTNKIKFKNVFISNWEWLVMVYLLDKIKILQICWISQYSP